MGVENKRAFSIKDALQFTGRLSAALILLYSVSLFALNKNQVEAIKKRDSNRCQYPGCTNKTKYNVEVHHVIPQGYSFKIQNMRPDTPFNAVCLCEEHHIGYPKDGRKQQTGMVWDPIHPDTYFVHLVLAGKFDLLPEKIKEKINADFPGLYEYYRDVSVSVKKRKFDYQVMYEEVMRKWRSDRLDNKEVYWNTTHDADLHISAINSTINAIRRGWRFPLRTLGGNVKPENRGMYAWDNLVAIAIQNYILKLTERELFDIFEEMKSPNNESRIVYYYRIYTPALAPFENRPDMAGVINNYLQSLPKEESAALVKKFDNAQDDDASAILYNDFYLPAVSARPARPSGDLKITA